MQSNDDFFNDAPLLTYAEAQAQAQARAAQIQADDDTVETRSFCGGHQLVAMFQTCPALEWDE